MVGNPRPESALCAPTHQAKPVCPQTVPAQPVTFGFSEVKATAAAAARTPRNGPPATPRTGRAPAGRGGRGGQGPRGPPALTCELGAQQQHRAREAPATHEGHAARAPARRAGRPEARTPRHGRRRERSRPAATGPRAPARDSPPPAGPAAGMEGGASAPRALLPAPAPPALCAPSKRARASPCPPRALRCGGSGRPGRRRWGRPDANGPLGQAPTRSPPKRVAGRLVCDGGVDAHLPRFLSRAPPRGTHRDPRWAGRLGAPDVSTCVSAPFLAGSRPSPTPKMNAVLNDPLPLKDLSKNQNMFPARLPDLRSTVCQVLSC